MFWELLRSTKLDGELFMTKFTLLNVCASHRIVRPGAFLFDNWLKTETNYNSMHLKALQNKDTGTDGA